MDQESFSLLSGAHIGTGNKASDAQPCSTNGARGCIKERRMMPIVPSYSLHLVTKRNSQGYTAFNLTKLIQKREKDQEWHSLWLSVIRTWNLPCCGNRLVYWICKHRIWTSETSQYQEAKTGFLVSGIVLRKLWETGYQCKSTLAPKRNSTLPRAPPSFAELPEAELSLPVRDQENWSILSRKVPGEFNCLATEARCWARLRIDDSSAKNSAIDATSARTE